MIELMCDPIKMEENIQRRNCTYVKSRERTTTVVNICTRVDIVQRKNKTSTVHTAKTMDSLLNNVTARKVMGKNAHTIIRRGMMKRSSGRKNKMKKKKKSKKIMLLKRYIIASSFL